MSKPKIVVLGHGRHGKDTVCSILAGMGLSFTSSSMFCAENVILPKMQGAYPSAQACFDDRHNHRALWYQLISDYNRYDPTRLGREILRQHDVYCGLRSAREFHALHHAKVFDYSIWVDASERIPPEDSDSCTVAPWMANFVVDNNGTEQELFDNVMRLMWERVLSR